MFSCPQRLSKLRDRPYADLRHPRKGLCAKFLSTFQSKYISSQEWALTNTILHRCRRQRLPSRPLLRKGRDGSGHNANTAEAEKVTDQHMNWTKKNSDLNDAVNFRTTLISRHPISGVPSCSCQSTIAQSSVHIKRAPHLQSSDSHSTFTTYLGAENPCKDAEYHVHYPLLMDPLAGCVSEKIRCPRRTGASGTPPQLNLPLIPHVTASWPYRTSCRSAAPRDSLSTRFLCAQLRGRWPRSTAAKNPPCTCLMKTGRPA